ncbi:LuxR C-terminal-related transcriptional regulator [Pseudomonas sp. RIT-To-2]|uniref:LuxR C-terminal-related transcriptional regulator n=1 Tax=Pseudomonas sp. RIT-To-2 TaxID=3462541 RepID=UPI0024130E89
MCELINFGGLQGLTGLLAPQELRAALGICSGLANKEIAREMDCSPATVKKSVERAFFKLNVTNRASLVAEAFRLGLIAFAGSMMPAPQRQQDEDHHQGVLLA